MAGLKIDDLTPEQLREIRSGVRKYLEQRKARGEIVFGTNLHADYSREGVVRPRGATVHPVPGGRRPVSQVNIPHPGVEYNIAPWEPAQHYEKLAKEPTSISRKVPKRTWQKIWTGRMEDIAKLEATGEDVVLVQLLDRKLSSQLREKQTVYLSPKQYNKVKDEMFTEKIERINEKTGKVETVRRTARRFADPEEPIKGRTLRRPAGREARALTETKYEQPFRGMTSVEKAQVLPTETEVRIKEVSKIELPEKIYGEGKMSPVKYVRITPGRTARHVAKRESLYGNLVETAKTLSPDEKTFLANRARIAKKGTSEYFKELATEYTARNEIFSMSKARAPEYRFMKKLFDSGRWKLPKKTLLALGAVGALGYLLMPREAEARGEGPLRTIATGAAATAVRRRKDIVPGLKRLSADSFNTYKEYEEYLALEDAIAVSGAKAKRGRDYFSSIFSAWIGEKWAAEAFGEFEPKIAGKILGEIPLWLIGGAAVKGVIKGGSLGAKLLRATATGALWKSIPEGMQALHGDKTVGEAMLSTAEEGVVWGGLDLIFHGVGGASKYLRGVGSWNGTAATAMEATTVQRSLLQKMMAYWPEKIGGPMWNGLVRQVKRIPGFEKLFVPSIRKLDVEARRSMEDTLAALDIGSNEARMLQEKIFFGTTINEAAFASDLYHSVPVIGADGKKIALDLIKKGMDPIAKEYGIASTRAEHILHNYVQPIRRAFWGKGKEAAAQHMLTQAKFAENLTYIPKKYRWHELNQFMKMRETHPFLPMSRRLRVQLKNFMKRLPPEATEHLDPITDLAYLTGKGLRSLTKDVELYKMYNSLARQMPSAAYASKKIKPGEVVERLIKRKGEIEPRKVFVRNKEWLKENDWLKLGSKKVKGTLGLPEYGALSGMYVPRALYESITDMRRVAGPMERVFARLLSKWKYGKVILRPATHARNLLSNLILNDLGGLAFYKIHRYAQAARAMKEKGANIYYREAMKTPMFALGGWAKYEVGADRALKSLARGGNMERFYDAWYKLRGRVQQIARVPSKAYDMEEKLFKMAKFIDNRKKGIAIREAYEDAMKWTFNYGEITPFIRGVKTWMMPFATFSYKALPIVAESVVKHPMRFAKWPAMAMGITWAALDRMDVTKEDWNHIKKVLPGYMRTGHFMLMPFRDAKGRLQMGDMTYIFPWGDIGELSQQGMLRLLQNPAFTLASQLSQNQNFFGQPIWYDWESPQVKAFKVFNHIWRQMTPAWSPDLALGTNPELKGGFDWNNISRAVKQDTEDAPTMGQALSSAFGLKLRAIEPKRERRKKVSRKQWQTRDAKAYYKRLIRNNPTRRKQLMLRKIEALRDIRKGDVGEFPGETWRGKWLAGNPLAWTPTWGLKEE